MKGACSIESCNHVAHCRGWCQTHYSRWRIHGDPQAEIPIAHPGRASDCCDRPHYAKGLCANHYMQKWAAEHPQEMELREVGHSAVKAGVDPVMVRAYFREHCGRCDVCGRTAAEAAWRDGGLQRRRLSVDHDHANGDFRGLLCNPCNQAIGHAGDDPARLRAMAAYLEQRA